MRNLGLFLYMKSTAMAIRNTQYAPSILSYMKNMHKENKQIQRICHTLFPLSNAYFQIGFCHERRSKLAILDFQMVIIVAKVGR